MNFTVEKAEFSKILSVVAGIADKNNKLANCILVQAQKDHVLLSATDLKSSVQRKLDVKPKAEGAFVVQASGLVDRIKSMPAGPVNMTVKDATLTIKAVGAARKFTMQIAGAEDFPKMPTVDTELASKIGRKDFLALAKAVQNAVSTDESRANLNSALLEWQNGKLTMTATNGHALVHAATPADVSGGQSVLLPKSAIDQVVKILSESKADGDESISVSFDESHASFKIGTSTFVTGIPQAAFPPYRDVVPKGRSNFVPVNRSKMIEACKALSVASDKGIEGGIVIQAESGKIKLSASSSNNGTSYDEIATDYAGEPKRVYLQAALVASNLSNIVQDEVLFSIEGPLDTVTVSVKGTDEVMGLLMPMRE